MQDDAVWCAYGAALKSMSHWKHRATALEDALRDLRGHLTSLQPALNNMARDVLDDVIADYIDAALAETPTGGIHAAD